MKATRISLLLAAVLCGYSAFAGDPTISDVTVRQRWPWSKLVDIDYVLTCDVTQTVDIAVSGFNDEMALPLPLASLSGDLYGVLYGVRRIVWDPTATAYTNAHMLSTFNVTLTPIEPPLYMIVDLTKTNGATDQIEYVYESELRAGTWGSWVENPVTNRGTAIQSVVWTGVTTNNSYKTDKLVLRRVPAGTFGMGDSTDRLTTLTRPFYAGVFAVTEAQWARVMGGSGSTAKPQTACSYDTIRGATNDIPTVNWPVTDRKVVTPGSFVGQLRLKTGGIAFDLPTTAQWEYLCRAETTTVFNDGNADAKYDGTEEDNNGLTNKYLNVLGWYNSVDCTAMQPVGLKVANAWGLYDTHGNASEWCLDLNGTISGGIDPVGPDAGLNRIARGGRWSNIAAYCRSAINLNAPPDSAGLGFRLVWTLP